jgi:hypothetical protein
MIKNRLLFLICLLPFCVGCNQNTDSKETLQQNNISIILSPSSTEETLIPKISNISPGKQNNSSEETKTEITIMAVQNTYSLSTDKVNVKITNNTLNKCTTGMDYSIEYYDGSIWSKVPIEFGIDDVIIDLPPQKAKEFSIYLYPEQYHYQPGTYRICKTVSSTDETYELTYKFNIQ